jgi:hypothetical protein
MIKKTKNKFDKSAFAILNVDKLLDGPLELFHDEFFLLLLFLKGKFTFAILLAN